MRTQDNPRNIEIIAKYKTGATLQEVADEYGVTRQRAHQIVSRFGYKKPHKIKLSREEKQNIRDKNKIANFWGNIDKNENGCWEWRGAKLPTGYGHLSWDKRQTYCHRIAWKLTNGEIPDGLQVLHRCDNPPCINPDHLFLGTVADNMRDRDAKGRNNKGKKLDKETGKFVVTK